MVTMMDARVVIVCIPFNVDGICAETWNFLWLAGGAVGERIVRGFMER